MNHQPKQLPPLAESYLVDLERALGDADDRAEVVHSVREHIVEALSEIGVEGRPAAISEILDQLGPVERLVRETDSDTNREVIPPRSVGASIAVAVLAAIATVFTWIAPIVGGVMSVAVLAISVTLLARNHHDSLRRGFYIFAVVVSAACVLFAAYLVLFVFSFQEPVTGPTLNPVIPD